MDTIPVQHKNVDNMNEFYIPECQLRLVSGDITRLNCDCIVNAANHALENGGGVNGAIHRAAGPELLEECRTLGGCETGQAKITAGYRLPAKYVIHTVGPVYGTPNAEQLLGSCYRNTLQLALEKGDIKTIAFPMISAGVFGYPKREAARIALSSVREWKSLHPDVQMEVTFCCADPEMYRYVQENMQELKNKTERYRSETKGLVFRKVELQFYPEDEEKMKNMTTREQIEFRRKLKDENRYIILNPEVFSE